MTRKTKSDDTLKIDLTKLDTPQTCQHCQHWRNKQSIFDFKERTGICLVPESDLLGYKRPNCKEFFEEGPNKGEPLFSGFSSKPNDRGLYFVTRQNFGCIKFEPTTPNN